MTFPLDLIRRVFLLLGLVLLSLPLWSLADLRHGSAPFPATAAVEGLVLVFIGLAGVVGLFDSRLFVSSRLFRPALVLGAVVLVLGSCDVLFQFAGARAAVEAVLVATTTYFADPGSVDLLQPTLAGLEFAALAPLVEIVLRGRAGVARIVAVAWTLSLLALAALVMSVATIADGWRSAVAGLPGSLGTFGELAELWVLGLVSWAWLLWAGFGPSALRSADRSVRVVLIIAVLMLAVVAGLGRPAIGYIAGVAASVCVGLAAALSPSPSTPAGTGSSRWVFWILGACVLVSAPFRVSAALWPSTVGVTGAGSLQPAVEDVMYRVAEQRSTWTLAPQAHTVNVLMRWDPTAASDCYVRIKVARRPNDEVSVFSDRWTLVRFALPPATSPGETRAVTFEVTSPSCRLLVGTITATR